MKRIHTELYLVCLLYTSVFYFFFGQNLSKQRIISRRTRKRITMQLEEPEHTEGPGIPPRYRPLASLLLNTLHSEPLYGSRIAVYTDCLLYTSPVNPRSVTRSTSNNGSVWLR